MDKLLKRLYPAALLLAGSMAMAVTPGRVAIKNDSKVPWEIWHETLWQESNFNAHYLNEAKEMVRQPLPVCLAITVLPGDTIELESVQKFPDRTMGISFLRENPIYLGRATFRLDLWVGEDPIWELKGGYPEHFVQPDGPGKLRLVDPHFSGPRRRKPGIQAILDQLDPRAKAVADVVPRPERKDRDR